MRSAYCALRTCFREAVIAGLDPAIHPFRKKFLRRGWTRGSSPRVTQPPIGAMRSAYCALRGKRIQVEISQRERQTRSAPSPATGSPRCFASRGAPGGGGVGRGTIARSIFLSAPSLSLHPKSDLSDFGQSISAELG
jgi:hypothetical protein